MVKCLPVEEPQNGRLISSAYEPNQEYTYGQVVKFECNAGFKLDGPAEIHCSGNGLWSRERPNCVGKMPLLLIVVFFFSLMKIGIAKTQCLLKNLRGTDPK